MTIRTLDRKETPTFLSWITESQTWHKEAVEMYGQRHWAESRAASMIAQNAARLAALVGSVHSTA